MGNCRESRTFRDYLLGFYEQPFRIAARKVTNARSGPSTFFGQPRIIPPRRRYVSGSDLTQGVKDMLRKTIVALFAVASIGLLAPTVASARGGFGGFHGGGGGFHGGGFGGFRGGGFHGGGFHGGGFHGGGFRGAGIGLGLLGLGLAGAYGAYGYPYGYGGYYGSPYAYSDYYDDGGCYLVRQRIWTSYGWRVRRVQVCD
jgi:hypothetical protein